MLPGLVGGKIYGVASEKLADVPIYSPPFLTARVIGDGPGQRFLDEQCPTGKHDFAVCRFSGRKFRNHNHFLWGVPGYDSAYQLSDLQTQRKLGEEQVAFVLTVAKTYPADQIAASTRNAVSELFAVTVGREHHTIPLIIIEWPEAQVLRVAPQYERCAADPAACPVPGFMRPWEILIELVFYLSLLVALAFAALTLRRPRDDRERLFNQGVLIVIPVLLANAVICGVLSGVHARYQARVEWVLPALVLAASPVIWARFKKPKHG